LVMVERERERPKNQRDREKIQPHPQNRDGEQRDNPNTWCFATSNTVRHTTRAAEIVTGTSTKTSQSSTTSSRQIAKSRPWGASLRFLPQVVWCDTRTATEIAVKAEGMLGYGLAELDGLRQCGNSTSTSLRGLPADLITGRRFSIDRISVTVSPTGLG